MYAYTRCKFCFHQFQIWTFFVKCSNTDNFFCWFCLGLLLKTVTMYILFWHFVSEDRHSFLNNNVSHSSGLFTFTKRKEHFRTVYIKFWKNSFDSLTWETTFNFAYIIQERPSVISGGWERAGIEMKLCSNGIQKKNQSDF